MDVTNDLRGKSAWRGTKSSVTGAGHQPPSSQCLLIAGAAAHDLVSFVLPSSVVSLAPGSGHTPEHLFLQML